MYSGFYKELEALRAAGLSDADFGFLENVSVGDWYNLYDFLHGHCDQFAVALSEHFGYDIEWVEDKDRNFLIHAYCVKELGNGEKAYIDARGITTDAVAFFDEFADWCDYDEESGLLYGPRSECKIFLQSNLMDLRESGERNCSQDKDLHHFLKDNCSYYDVNVFEREICDLLGDVNDVVDKAVAKCEELNKNVEGKRNIHFEKGE